jgi:Arc/MetJ family transcription regulator
LASDRWTISWFVCILGGIYTHGQTMRTNIDIDDELLTEAMAVTGLPTKKATVEEALRRVVSRHRRRTALADMADLGWEGDLDAMREGRGIEPVP